MWAGRSLAYCRKELHAHTVTAPTGLARLVLCVPSYKPSPLGRWARAAESPMLGFSLGQLHGHCQFRLGEERERWRLQTASSEFPTPTRSGYGGSVVFRFARVVPLPF